jgi:hypothetical protein
MAQLVCEIAMDDYIAHPYWPERYEVIQITKKSGVNRVCSEDKREKTLTAFLDKLGLKRTDWEDLQRRADRPWYRADNDDDTSEIIIPRHQMSAAIVQALKTAPAAVRGGYREESFRAQVRLGDLATDKTKADDVFTRFVKLDESNQRNLQSNPLIRDFTAAGTIDAPGIDGDDTKQLARLRDLLIYVLRECGVGACRKMGYGRGQLLTLRAAEA